MSTSPRIIKITTSTGAWVTLSTASSLEVALNAMVFNLHDEDFVDYSYHICSPQGQIVDYGVGSDYLILVSLETLATVQYVITIYDTSGNLVLTLLNT